MKFFKKRIVYTLIVTLIVVFSSTFAILMTLERTDYRNYLQAEYSRNMYDLINSVQNIRISLGKAAVIGSNEQNIITFDNIFRYSSMANDKLHSLPITEQESGSTSKFLSQVGDFCYSLAKVSSEGKELTDKDYATIDRLKNESFSLEQQLKNILDQINKGNVRWGEIRKNTSSVLASNQGELLDQKFATIQKQVTDYPALIYDGPFSDNTISAEPKINSQKEVSSKEAENIAKNIVGKNKVKSIKLDNSQGNEKINTYRFSISDKNEKNTKSTVCEITKKGGKVLYLINDRAIGNKSIDANKAVTIGSKYLEDIGYKNMVPTYTMNYGTSLVISYVYKQQNIIIYPDQIKLKVALDNGEIIGIESQKYLISHEENRNIVLPKVTRTQAKSKVGKKLKISSERLAIIPTEDNRELLCYEFSGVYENDQYIVYINAETGKEQKILQIINTPNGSLAM
ncbi:germination protein YpeB [Clostridium fermenticellae]|uniref:Germination protein YpeB n=1 Tax=Clostridium fermenticellae TaxID=2068654 RepID=A0A386H0I9_9CLOT|nr:germination protein YpeB [Clostridium fermenticellae]AYD39179.1 germination protein YpeB [Clostridium fermenticellae]